LKFSADSDILLLCCRLCSSDGYVYAYLHNDDASEVASPEPAKTSGEDILKLSTSSVHPYSSSSAHAYSTAVVDVGRRRLPSAELNSEVKIPTKQPRTVKNFAAVKDVKVNDKSDKSDMEFRYISGTSSSASSNKWSLMSVSSSACSSQASDRTSDSSSQVQIDIGQEDFLLHPGSFRVLLCMDNQEFYAKYVLDFCLYFFYPWMF